MEYKHLLVDNQEGIATITVNREKSLNALNAEVIEELHSAFHQLGDDESVDVIILTGAGRSFVAGADITEMANHKVSQGAEMARRGMDAFRCIENLNRPVIAAVNGFALGGGCELAMSCDIRVASTKAKFGQPEVGLGITPGFGGTQRLSRLVGMGKAKQLIFTSAVIDAQEAHRIGLVDEVYEAENLMEEAKKLAKQIQKQSQLAVRAAKKAINTGMQVDIDSAMMIEESLFATCFATEDQKEGMKAFIEKRKPNFTKK